MPVRGLQAVMENTVCDAIRADASPLGCRGRGAMGTASIHRKECYRGASKNGRPVERTPADIPG